jgi:hypothetical protein
MHKLFALTFTALVALPALPAPALARSMEAGDAEIVRRDDPGPCESLCVGLCR